jgi:hypothetical protein
MDYPHESIDPMLCNFVVRMHPIHFADHERYRVDESELCIYHYHYYLLDTYLPMLYPYNPLQNCNSYAIFESQDPDSISQERRAVHLQIRVEVDTLDAPYKTLNFVVHVYCTAPSPVYNIDNEGPVF